jgi:hypothetical protein
VFCFMIPGYSWIGGFLERDLDQDRMKDFGLAQ